MLTVLQWNVGEFRSRSTELLDFISSHPVDLVCVQESNLKSSFSFRNPGYSALRSNRIHSRSNILSLDDPHASGDVVIFIRQSRFFSELSTSPLSSPHPYSNYAGINMLLNNFFSLPFLNVCVPPTRSSLTDSKTDFFFPSILLSFRNLCILKHFNSHYPLRDSKGTCESRGEELLNWVIFSDLLPHNDPYTPTFLFF